MKYCPNPACPHRARVHESAEFIEHVAACSDCSALLVRASDLEEALKAYGTRTVGGPYRAVKIEAPKPRDTRPDARERAMHDRVIGMALMVGSVVLAILTYAFTSTRDGSYVLAWGPAFYGVYRWMRGSAGGASAGR